MESIIKVYPTVEECKINNLVTCPAEGCHNIFTSESNLTLHLAKSHKDSNAKKLLQKGEVKQYHCPQTECKKFFKSMKLLRQHYLKVHTEKGFFCFSCQKAYASELLRNDHEVYCGVKFYCCDCTVAYESYETLQTHGRRKKHNYLDKKSYKANTSTATAPVTNESKIINRLLLPKISGNIQLIVLPSKKTMVNQECQTSDEKPLLKTKTTQIHHALVPQNTQQTQTGSKNEQFSVETQTIGDYFTKRTDIHIENAQISANTQTDVVESNTTSCNTSFNLDDFELTLKNDVEKSHSGTQTIQNELLHNIYSIATATHDSIHTDTLDLLTDTLNDNLSNFDSNFFNCHMETQTDDLLSPELFTCDYYTNMCTQTCDEILSSVDFCDSHTQTGFYERLRSVESQTSISQKRSSCKDMSNMETQTDVEFRQMLEIINS